MGLHYQDNWMHFYTAGDDVIYHLIYENGEYERHILGNVRHNPAAKYALSIPGNVYVAIEIEKGWALISPVNTPGFNPDKMDVRPGFLLQRQFPQHSQLLSRIDQISNNDVPLDLPKIVK